MSVEYKNFTWIMCEIFVQLVTKFSLKRTNEIEEFSLKQQDLFSDNFLISFWWLKATKIPNNHTHRNWQPKIPTQFWILGQWRIYHGCYGCFSTRNIGTIYYSHRPLAPAILGQYITVSTRDSKDLNTPLQNQRGYAFSGLYRSQFKFRACEIQTWIWIWIWTWTWIWIYLI